MTGRSDSQITCTIGSKPSRAQYYVMDVSNVHEILDSLKNTVGVAR